VVSDSGESKGFLTGEECLEECEESGTMGSRLINLPVASRGGRLVDLDIRWVAESDRWDLDRWESRGIY
jgi:hypothetical protein